MFNRRISLSLSLRMHAYRRLPHARLKDVELDSHCARLDLRAVQRDHLPKGGRQSGGRGTSRERGGELRSSRRDRDEIAWEIAGGRTSTSSCVIMDCASGSSRAPPKKERAGRSCRGGRAAPVPRAAASTVERTIVPASRVAATGEMARPHTPSAMPCASPSAPRCRAPGAGVGARGWDWGLRVRDGGG